MFFSERLLNPPYVIGSTIFERSTGTGKDGVNVSLNVPGRYRITLIGGGGLSQAIYTGDSTISPYYSWINDDGRGWMHTSGATGGAGGKVVAIVYLDSGTYNVMVGNTHDRSSTSSFSGTVKVSPSWGDTTKYPNHTYFRNSGGTVLLAAYGGGAPSYEQQGSQKNDGNKYIFTAAAPGGKTYIRSSLTVISSTATTGSSGVLRGFRGDQGDYTTMTSSTTSSHGKAHNLKFGYDNYDYKVNYKCSGGIDGYAKIEYLG